MKVEFTGRFQDKRKKTQEEEDSDTLQRIVNPDYIPEVKTKYMYDPITLDLNNIDEWVRIDPNHTQLIMKKGHIYVVKLPYLLFCKLYEDLTGTGIRVVEVSEMEAAQFHKEENKIFLDNGINTED